MDPVSHISENEMRGNREKALEIRLYAKPEKKTFVPHQNPIH